MINEIAGHRFRAGMQETLWGGKFITQTKSKGGIVPLMVGLGIACFTSVMSNLSILGNFADMSQLSVELQLLQL